MIRRRLLAIAAVAWATGCGVLLGEQADPPVTTPQAGTDGATNDATFDAEAGTDVDGGACNSRFCSDFDPPNDTFPYGWTATGALPFGLGLTGDASTTPPNALDITSSADAGSSLALLVPNATLPVRWSFDHRILTTGDGQDLELFDLYCTEDTGVITDRVKVKIKSDSHKVKLQTNNGGSSDSIDVGTTGAFVSIVVEVDTNAARLIVGTAPLEISANCPKTGAHTISLGVVDNGARVWRVQIDRVRGDWL